ncbi:MFS domain-containing protein [Caerostris darwini]|uniref:MFS domain-containing protein n=1 Tax=Caerostris darwini TaxID=1538125 RepID=A0AAV4VTP3_9ARAC|nr:MFS domain-containing protein [Caerostris darwini]
MTRISGLLFVGTMDLHHVNREQASFPFVFGVTMRYVSGPLSGLLARRMGIRFVIVVGCCMAFVGVGSCFLAQNILQMILLWGVLYGMGCGLATCILPQIVNLYFKKHVTKAYGLTYAGSSLSGFVLPPIAEILLEKYGISGTFLILSGIVLHGFAAAILLKKPKFEISSDTSDKRRIFNIQSDTEVNSSSKLSLDQKSHHDLPMQVNRSDYFKKDKYMLSSDQSKHDSNSDIKLKVSHSSENGTKSEKDEYKVQENSLKNPTVTLSTTRQVDLTTGGLTLNSKQNNVENLKSNSIRLLNIRSLPDDISKCTDKEHCNINKNSEILISKQETDHSCTEFLQEKIEKDASETSSIAEEMSCLYDLSIFKDPLYLCLCIGEAFASFLFVVTPTILVDYGLDIGISIKSSTYLLMCFSVSDMTGSIVLGWIIDTGILSKTNFSSLCFLVSAGSFVILVTSSSFLQMMVGVILEGVSLGALGPIFPGIIADYIEKGKQTVAISSIGFLFVPLSFTPSPLIGFFRDGIGSYSYMFYLMCAISICCSVLFLFMPKIATCRSKN